MKQKDSNGPEIAPWEMEEPKQKPVAASVDQDEELKKITRHSFRGTVSDSDAAAVQINDQRFNVSDIGSRGIGIILPRADIFSIGDTLSIDLLLHGKTFALQGTIKHISPMEGFYLCGIELINLDEDAEEKLQTFLQTKRINMFASEK